MCAQCDAWVPERSKGADLRSAGCNVRVGSNPTSGMRSSCILFYFLKYFLQSLGELGEEATSCDLPTQPPWPNWTRRAPPKGEIAGSSPAGGRVPVA